MSRKPLARPFQKWVAKTIREIRLTGKYELERSLNEERDKGKRALDAGQLALEEERNARVAAEEKAVQLQAKLAGKYAPGQQIYVLMNPADANRNLYKLGRTRDLSKRIGNFKTSMPDGCLIMYTVNCIDSIACERAVGKALEKYLYNREWYQCELSIIVHAMNTAVSAHDGMIRNVDYLEKYDIHRKMTDMFKDVEDKERLLLLTAGPLQTDTRPPSPQPRRGIMDWFSRHLRTPELDNSKDPLIEFVEAHFQKSDNEQDRIKRKTVHEALENWCRSTGRRELLQKKQHLQHQLRIIMSTYGFTLDRDLNEKPKMKRIIGEEGGHIAFSNIKVNDE